MKIGEKEAQRRAFRERGVVGRSQSGSKPGKPTDPRWALPDGTFDRTAYQREYMRKRRARLKEET